MRNRIGITLSQIPNPVILLLFATTTSVIIYGCLLIWAKSSFGFERIFGWDTLVYAFSAQETLREGLGWLHSYWGHPNVYVLILAIIIGLTQEVSVVTNATPVALVVLLSFLSGRLAGKMTDSMGVSLVATTLATLSMMTFRLFVDLHRAFFAFTGVTILIAMESPQAFSRTRLNSRGALLLLLLFLVAFAEFEIYLVYVAALALTLVIRARKGRNFSLPIAWSAIPGVVFALTPATWTSVSVVLAREPFKLVEELTLPLALMYISTAVAIPFLVLGVLYLSRICKTTVDMTSAFLLSWVVLVTAILISLGFLLQRISPFRALILLHVPILTAVGAKYFVTIGSRWLRYVIGRVVSHRRRARLPRRFSQTSYAILAVSLVLISGTQLQQNAETFLRPVVPNSLYSRLLESSNYVTPNKWPIPIYLVTNETHIRILPPVRFELGMLNGPTLLYYGDLNLVPWLVPPDLVAPGAVSSTLDAHFIHQEYDELGRWLSGEVLEPLSHPIVVISPELFTLSLPTSFERFRVGKGIYVIPPYSLSLETFLQWDILAEEDAYEPRSSIIVDRTWSLTGRVVEVYTKEPYEISFPYFFPVQGNYTMSVHMFDFPDLDYNSTVPLSPIELLVGNTTVASFFYGQNKVIWWNVTLDRTFPGFDRITISGGGSGLPVRVSLDLIRITAQQTPVQAPSQDSRVKAN